MRKAGIEMRVRLTGLTPGLLMHNARLANPMDPITQQIGQITAKPSQKRTTSDYEELARLEFLGGLYWDEGETPRIPGDNILAMIRAGAKGARRGNDVLRGVLIVDDWSFVYGGPEEPNALWANERFRDVRGVKIGRARVMRCRPFFGAWTSDGQLIVLPEVLDQKVVAEALMHAGAVVGLGDYRPRFGRFDVEFL